MLTLMRLVLAVSGLLALAATPVLAGMDEQCISLADAMRAEVKPCELTSRPGYYVISCVERYRGQITQVASACISAAQDHYAAASGLDGYDADRELLAAATLEGSASTANYSLGNCNLAFSQLDSIIKLLSRVTADPYVGDLIVPAKKELAEARSLLQTAKQMRC